MCDEPVYKYKTPQNIPRAISVLTLGNKVIVYGSNLCSSRRTLPIQGRINCSALAMLSFAWWRGSSVWDPQRLQSLSQEVLSNLDSREELLDQPFSVSTSVLCHNASSTESSRSVSVFQRPPFPWIPILWILWSRHRHADWKWRIYLWQLSRLMTDKRLMSAACSGLSSSRALECKLCVSLRLSKWWKEVGWTL